MASTTTTTTTKTTKTIDTIVAALVDELEVHKKGAVTWMKKEASARNKLALEAANNNLDLGKELKLLSPSEVGPKLFENYEHTKKWEKQFRDWGGFRNGYAEYCHKMAKDAFYDALLKVKKLNSTVSDVNFNLKCVFSTTGGSSGSRVLRVKTGSSSTETISSELSTSIKASIKGPIAAFTGGLEGSISTQLTESFTGTSFREEEEELTVNLDKPCYVYQVVGSFSTAGGGIFNIGGNLRIFDFDVHKKMK